jgi:hypothetical protein
MVRHLVHIFLQRHSSPVFGRPSAVTQSRTAPTCVHLGRTWNTQCAHVCDYSTVPAQSTTRVCRARRKSQYMFRAARRLFHNLS